MTMNRRLIVAVLVAAILAISSAAAAAAGFELGEINVGGSVSYGTLTISDFQNYDRYIATLPVFAVSGRYEVLPNVNLLVDYVFGSRALDEDDVYWDDQETYYVNDYMYRHLSLAGTVGMTKNLDLYWVGRGLPRDILRTSGSPAIPAAASKSAWQRTSPSPMRCRLGPVTPICP